MSELHRTLRAKDRIGLSSEGVCKVYRNALGQKKVCGGPRLKETQAYTRKFGRTVANLKKKWVLKLHVKNSIKRSVCQNTQNPPLL